MKQHRIRRISGFILLAIAGVFLFGNIVMLLWNALLPALFHFPLIGFWQALGLLVLAKILFGGFRGGGPGRHWKNRMHSRWANMTPEEKERFREDWGHRCGRGPHRGTPSEMASQGPANQ